MKDIKTLPEDIYSLLDRSSHHEPNPDLLKEYGERASATLARSFQARTEGRDPKKIWFSDLGEHCERKLWYKFHEYHNAEAMGGHTLFKFSYGDTLEDKVLYLAKEAGHTVEHEQERIEYYHEPTGITLSGRIDAVIDGVLVDVKSTSNYGFKKYTTEGVTPENDSFGYRFQLSGYYQLAGKGREHIKLDGSLSKITSNHPAFIFIDKQNGHIAYVPIDPLTKDDIDNEITRISTVLSRTENKGLQRLSDKPEGKSGNKVLCTECSYCPFKQRCWSVAEGAAENLRTFLYSTGPKSFTRVENLPRVYEVINSEE